MDLKIQTIRVGDLVTNCYLVSFGQDALIIDPGGEAARLVQEIEKNRFLLQYILITHAHFDHVLAVDDLALKYPRTTIAAGEKDIPYLHRLSEQGERTGGRYCDVRASVLPLSEGATLRFADFDIKVLETPGHTKGGVTFWIKDNLFDGDTLFYHSYGRTDFPESDTTAMKKSLKKLLTLPESLKVYPGHGQATTITEEKNYYGI